MGAISASASTGRRSSTSIARRRRPRRHTVERIWPGLSPGEGGVRLEDEAVGRPTGPRQQTRLLHNAGASLRETYAATVAEAIQTYAPSRERKQEIRIP